MSEESGMERAASATLVKRMGRSEERMIKWLCRAGLLSLLHCQVAKLILPLIYTCSSNISTSTLCLS